jgi:hypothetical protein
MATTAASSCPTRSWRRSSGWDRTCAGCCPTCNTATSRTCSIGAELFGCCGRWMTREPHCGCRTQSTGARVWRRDRGDPAALRCDQHDVLRVVDRGLGDAGGVVCRVVQEHCRRRLKTDPVSRRRKGVRFRAPLTEHRAFLDEQRRQALCRGLRLSTDRLRRLRSLGAFNRVQMAYKIFGAAAR